MLDVHSVAGDILVKFMKHMDGAKPSSLCTVLWGAGALGCFEHDFWQAAHATLLTQVEYLGIEEVTNATCAYAKLFNHLGREPPYAENLL